MRELIIFRKRQEEPASVRKENENKQISENEKKQIGENERKQREENAENAENEENEENEEKQNGGNDGKNKRIKRTAVRQKREAGHAERQKKDNDPDGLSDVYHLSLPYVTVSVRCTGDRYTVCEPPFPESLKMLKERIRDHLLYSEILNGSLKEGSFLKNVGEKSHENGKRRGKSCDGSVSGVSRADDGRLFEKAVMKILRDYDIRLSPARKNVLFYYLFRDLIGYGRIEPVLRDPLIEDISCNGYDLPVYVCHRLYGTLVTDISFGRDELDRLVRRFAGVSGKSLTIAGPLADASLPDGSRAQLSLGSEITTKGSTFTIRKFTERPFRPDDLVRLGTFPPGVMAYLRLAVESGMNIMFAGGTACGKTTAVNAVSYFIPEHRKIISIEDTREISLPHRNWISGVSRQPVVMEAGSAAGQESTGSGGAYSGLYGAITLYDLLKTAMRQRPEYIIVGEVRGSEAYVLFQAMSTGHATLSTIHAESVDRLIHRLENTPMSVPKSMIQVLDILVILGTVRIRSKAVKKCLFVHEIVRTDPRTGEVVVNDVYDAGKEDRPTAEDLMSRSVVLEKICLRTGKTPEELDGTLSAYQRSFEKEAESDDKTLTAETFLKNG